MSTEERPMDMGEEVMEGDAPESKVDALDKAKAKGKGKAKSVAATPPAPPPASTPAGEFSLQVPWVEKYRPRVLTDVVGNEEAIRRLRVVAEQGNMPNLILSGPPGTGKTTSVVCLANALLGPAVKDGLLELNASDDRGIDVVRNKIKMFAQKKVTLPAGRHKIVILDEADSMTKGAQQALRRTMELYSSTTRFALACNNSTKVIEPLQSRCAILRYAKLTSEQVLKRVVEVCDMEKVARDHKGLESIVFTAEGDMRYALNNLQATVAGFGMVSEENVFRVCDQPHPLLVSHALMKTYDYQLDESLKYINKLWIDGYAAVDIVGALFRVVKTLPLPEEVRLQYIKQVGLLHMRIADGVTTLLQLRGLMGKLTQIAKASGSTGAPLTVSTKGAGAGASAR